MNHRPNLAARRAAALVLAMALVPLAASAQTNVKPGWNLFSAEQDVQIGQQSAVQAEQQLPILRDTEVQNYVNRIGQKLARNAGGPGFQYQFRVVNASDINAFALPGGYIYLNRGIIDQARNEGEVAGVLAHEIAHSALRHGTHQASKAYAAQAGISILGGLLGGRVGGGTMDIINAVGGLGLNALFLKYSRDLETQADIRGAQILAASGYAPADMVGFFQTLERQSNAKKTNWLSSHPAPPDRIRRIQQEATLLRVANNPTVNTAELRQVQSRMARYGAAPTTAQIAQGATSGSTSRGRTSNSDYPPMTSSAGGISVPAPSSSWRTFTNRSGSLQVGYPSNWRVYESSGFGVTLAPEGGIGSVGGKTEVVYGAIVNHYDPFGNANSLRSGQVTLQTATEDLVRQIRQGSPHLSVVRNSAQNVSVDGRTGIAASLRGRNPNTGINERVTVVTRALADGHVMYMLFVTPDADASRYSTVLNTMLRSINVDDGRAH